MPQLVVLQQTTCDWLNPNVSDLDIDETLNFVNLNATSILLLFSFVFRRDVTSRFSSKDDNNVGYFPSGSFGWNISEEIWELAILDIFHLFGIV